jgi:hypothetical protein
MKTKIKNVETRFVDMSTNIKNELKNGQYVVLASQPDGVISIGINGKYGFDTLKEAVDIQFDHINIDKDVKVSVFRVQKEVDEYGFATIKLVQAEVENAFIGEDPHYISNGSYAVCQSITCTDDIITNVLERFDNLQEAIEGERSYIDNGYTNTFIVQLFCYKNADRIISDMDIEEQKKFMFADIDGKEALKNDFPLFKAYRLSE